MAPISTIRAWRPTTLSRDRKRVFPYNELHYEIPFVILTLRLR